MWDLMQPDAKGRAQMMDSRTVTIDVPTGATLYIGDIILHFANPNQVILKMPKPEETDHVPV